MTVSIWTVELEHRLVSMREDEGASFADIADELGLAESVVTNQYYRICQSLQKGERAKFRRADVIEQIEEASVARCRREEHALATGDVTAVFFGDPLPGRSALDRMRARQ